MEELFESNEDRIVFRLELVCDSNLLSCIDFLKFRHNLFNSTINHESELETHYLLTQTWI